MSVIRTGVGLVAAGVLFGAARVQGEAAAAIQDRPALALKWKKEEASLALLNGARVVWQYQCRAEEGKPYFHPLATMEGEVVSGLRPDDHPWHRSLWFSWKFINGLNYWEEDRKTGLSQGRTYVTERSLVARDDFSAELVTALAYGPPEKEALLTERRTINVSAPAADGSYRLDWVSVFTAVEVVELERTPLAGEPSGAAYGGYAGVSLRMAEQTRTWAFVDSEGRSEAAIHGNTNRWVAAWGTFPSGTCGTVALFEHPSGKGAPSAWYVAKNMPYFSPAVLYRNGWKLAKGETFTLKYRVLVVPRVLERPALETCWQEYIQPHNNKGTR